MLVRAGAGSQRRSWISKSCSRRSRSSLPGSRHFTVFSVYLLDERRGDLKHCLRASATRKRSSSTSACRWVRASSGAAVAEQRPILLDDVDQRPALLARGARHALAAGGAAAQQGQGDRRAQPAERSAAALHRARRVDPAPVRRARRAGDRQRAAVRVGARIRANARDAGGDRPRDERDSRSRRAADRASRTWSSASSTTASSASRCSTRRRRCLEMKVAIKYGDDARRCRRSSSAKAWSATRRSTRKPCSCRT